MIIDPIIINGRVLRADNTIALTYHNDDNYQAFETTIGCYVYNKKEEKIYQITLEAFNKMLIKLAALLPQPEIKNYNYENSYKQNKTQNSKRINT